MADGFFPTLVSKDANANTQTNPLFTGVTDGTDLLLINADGSLNAVVTATNLDIRDLTHVSDSVKVGDGTDFVAVNADGSLNITDNGGSLTVDATDLDIRDLTLAQDAVRVSANTTANSPANPIYVQVSNGVSTGEVHDYDTAAAVAGGGTSNHDYTAVATFTLSQITVSSSGACKVEVINDATGTPVAVFTGFVPKAGGTLIKTFDPAVEVATGDVLRLTRTNREGSPQDLYSTIEGIDA